jgi:hypothetical protein
MILPNVVRCRHVVVGDEPHQGLDFLRGADRARLGCGQWHLFPRPVVAAVGLHHEWSTGVCTGGAHRLENRLGARVCEPHLLNRRHSARQFLGQPELRPMRRGIDRPQARLGGDRLDDARVGVPMNERRVVVQEVDVGIAVDVVKLVAVGVLDHCRIGLEPRHRTRIATRHDASQTLVQPA